MLGQTISHYRITEKLGEGGMGVVYKAEDAKLERTVALKFLAAHLVSDEDIRKRFEREAKAAAVLNHPNICHVYEIDEADGKTFIAMAFIEGQGLDGKIAAGPLKLDEALDIAHQIAQGLRAAHAKGIVHRDIKPANVMVTCAGSQRQVTIMDFGLAQLTEHSKLTRLDETMGTVAYMSPEQTAGAEVDHRSDIWALGVALYEMITGQQPFKGHYSQAVMYSITSEEPEPPTALRTGVPMELEWIVGKCLAKEADNRYQNAGDMAVDLKNLQEKLKSGRSAILRTSLPGTVGARHAVPAGTETEMGTRAQHAVPLQGTWKRHLPWALFAVTALVALALAFMHFREAPPPEMPPLEFTVSLPEGVQPQMFSLSPDGRHVVIATGTIEGPGTLWVRPLDSLEGRALAGTGEARYPFWSPDSQYIGFFAQGKLKKVALAAGPPQSLCDAEDGRGGSWSQEGVILFAPSPFGEIQRVAEGGGAPIAVTEGNESEQARSRRFPQFLPGGRHFLYLDGAATDAERVGVYLGSLAGEAPRRLLPDDTNAVYVPSPGGEPPGYLLFVREYTLMARPFDAQRLEFSGDVFPVAEQVAGAGNVGFYGFSASATGVLVYVSSESLFENNQLTWLDRQGKLLEAVGDPGAILGVSLSPDARRAAVAMVGPDARQPDIWLVEMGRNTFSRFTSQPEPEIGPVWSPSGDRIAFTWTRQGRPQVHWKDAGGGGEAELVSGIPVQTAESLMDWSPDGRFMAVGREGPNRGMDLWVRSVSGEEQPFPFLATEFTEIAARFSPDGNWLAYQSDKSGRFEVYLRPFPKSDREWKISTDGGRGPRWRGDGRELYFVAPDRTLMAAAVRAGETVEAGVPAPLFKTNLTPDPYAPPPYDVTADGRRFLVLVPSEERSQPPLTVTTNWLAKARR